MRILLLAALPAVLFAQAGGVVEGTVTNRTTHGGIEGVEVMVQSVTSQNGPDYTGTTDASGAFHIEGVPDGEYRANFGKPGFVPGDIGLMTAAAAVSRNRGRWTGAPSIVTGPGSQAARAGGGSGRASHSRCHGATGPSGRRRTAAERRPGRMAFSNWANYFPPRS